MLREHEVFYGSTKYFQPFPEPHTVFSGDVERHSELFLPLARIDLNHMNPDWEGYLPIVTTIEPCDDGLFAENSPKHHSYLCRENWIGFHLKNNKVEYAGDWRLFENDNFSTYYKSVHEGFQRAKTFFKENNCLRYYNGSGKDPVCGEHDVTMGGIGGHSHEGNWAHTSNFPVSSNESGEAFPLTQDGRQFEYIGGLQVSDYIYGDDEARFAMGCGLIVFFDPKDQVVLCTFEWT